MARMRMVLSLPLLLLVWATCAQESSDVIRRQVGDCARCHVISVVEWGCSTHRSSGATCQDCHGPSTDHVRDERNNVKPDRIPRAGAIAKLCLNCHEQGCPSAKETAACQKCHHVHALMDPRKPPTVRDDRLEQLEARWQRYDQNLQEGDRLVQALQWASARAAFERALLEKPGDRIARERIAMCRRRLLPGLAGLDIVGTNFHQATGLPLEVRVAGLGIPMRLICGGEFDLGSDQFAHTQPVHRTRIEPFYLAQHELTRNEWQAIAGSLPASPQAPQVSAAARQPVSHVSWEDAETLLRTLNSRIAGAEFRLPTEAEWEWAARAGGESDEAFNLLAPRTVEQGRPNRLGLFDLAGNVREWCSSRFTPYPYNPKDGREDRSQTVLRVLRGGAFSEPADWYDPALRHGERPERRLSCNGLRIARSIGETE